MDLDHRISPSLHPSILEEAVNHPTVGPDHGRAAEHVLSGVYGDLKDLLARTEEIRADKRLSDEGQREKIAKLRETVLGSVDGQLDHAAKRIANAIGFTEKKMADATRPETKSASEAEIRAYVRSLSDATARASFLHVVSRDGDRETVNAILQAPRYLSGFGELDAAGWSGLQDQVRRNLAPELADQHAVLTRLLGRLETARKMVPEVR